MARQVLLARQVGDLDLATSHYETALAMLGDGNARALATREQVDEWFQVKELRAESARQRTLAHLEDAKRAL